jgi:hypothetical protein
MAPHPPPLLARTGGRPLYAPLDFVPCHRAGGHARPRPAPRAGRAPGAGCPRRAPRPRFDPPPPPGLPPPALDQRELPPTPPARPEMARRRARPRTAPPNPNPQGRPPLARCMPLRPVPRHEPPPPAAARGAPRRAAPRAAATPGVSAFQQARWPGLIPGHPRPQALAPCGGGWRRAHAPFPPPPPPSRHAPACAPAIRRRRHAQCAAAGGATAPRGPPRAARRLGPAPRPPAPPSGAGPRPTRPRGPLPGAAAAQDPRRPARPTPYTTLTRHARARKTRPAPSGPPARQPHLDVPSIPPRARPLAGRPSCQGAIAPHMMPPPGGRACRAPCPPLKTLSRARRPGRAVGGGRRRARAEAKAANQPRTPQPPSHTALCVGPLSLVAAMAACDSTQTLLPQRRSRAAGPPARTPRGSRALGAGRSTLPLRPRPSPAARGAARCTPARPPAPRAGAAPVVPPAQLATPKPPVCNSFPPPSRQQRRGAAVGPAARGAALRRHHTPRAQRDVFDRGLTLRPAAGRQPESLVCQPYAPST